MLNMDEKKRMLVTDDCSSEQMKRIRPEDIIGILKDDPSRVATRIVLNKYQFSKVIGKAGQMIASIRSVSGCTMRGIDLDDENRLVVMVGTLVQVVNAFDLVTQHALRTHTGAPPFSPPSHSASAANGRETGVVTLLVEHSKVGKVVGPKGGTLQQLRKKSGAIVTVEKEQVELSGVALRKVILDGSVAAMRWAHYLIHELSVDPQAAELAMRYLCTAGAPAANPAQGQSYGATNTGRGHYSNSNNNSISNNCNGGNYHVDIADTMAMTQFSSSLPVHVPLPVPVPGLPPAAGSSAVSSNHRITYPISSCSGLNSHSSGRNTFYSSPMDGSMPQPPSAALAHMQSLHSMHSAVHHPLHNQLAYHPVHQNSGHGMIQQQHQPQHQSHLSPPYQQQLQQQQQHVPFDAQSQLKMNSVSASAHFAPPSGVNRPQPISSSPHVSYSQYPGVPGGATASSSFLQWSSPQQSQPQYQQQYQQYQHQLQQQQQQQSYPPSAQGTGGSKCPSTPVQQHAAVNLLPAPQADCAAATQERGDCDDASRCSDVHASQPLLLQHYQSDQHHSNQREHHNQPQAQHIALSSLRSLGVPAEVVGQLVDLQAYLLRKCGLVLSVSREEEDREGLGLGLEQGHEQHHLQQQQQPLGVIACSGGGGSAKELFQAGRHGELAEEHSGRSAESVIALRKATTTSSIAPSIAPSITAGSSASPPAAQVLYFPIPCACVGGIIGRGGRGLRELQAEFGVRVYVEKEEYLGQRIVALSYIGAGVNAGVGAGVGTGVEARRASSPGANSNSYCEELDEGPAGRDGSQCVENHNRECDRREGGSDFPTARARSRSDSLSLGALDRDLQIEDEEGEGEGETERGGEHDLLRGECEVGEGLEGEEELQDKFLPDLALAKPSRGSAAFVSINALLHGGASNCHNARAKTKRPASTSDADSEHTPSSSGGNGGGVSAGGKNRAAVAKYKRNRTDIDCFVSDPAAVAFDAGHGGSPIEQEPFVDCLSQSPTQQKQPHQLSPQRDQGEGAGGGRSKSKRGYASEGEEGCSGGCGERRGKDHRKSLRTATAAGGGGAVMPLNRERERACSVTAIGEVPLQRRGPLLSTTVPSSFSWVSQTLRAPRSVSEARSRLSSSSGDDDDVIDININNRKGTGRSRFTGEQLVDSDDADDRAPSNSTSNSSSKILSRGNNSHNSHQAVQLPKRAEEGAAATVHELSQQQEQQVGSRSKRKRTSGGEEDLPPNSPPTIPSHTSPVTGNSTSCSGQQLELVSVGSASAAHVATTASIPSSDAPSSTRTVEMQVMALQRCKERIEAMIEDILQRQVRDVGNNDL